MCPESVRDSRSLVREQKGPCREEWELSSGSWCQGVNRVPRAERTWTFTLTLVHTIGGLRADEGCGVVYTSAEPLSLSY